VPACAREWTRVSYLSFPRNEGVPGSSPGVGFSGFAGVFPPGPVAFDPVAGTKRVREPREASRARLARAGRPSA